MSCSLPPSPVSTGLWVISIASHRLLSPSYHPTACHRQSVCMSRFPGRPPPLPSPSSSSPPSSPVAFLSSFACQELLRSEIPVPWPSLLHQLRVFTPSFSPLLQSALPTGRPVQHDRDSKKLDSFVHIDLIKSIFPDCLCYSQRWAPYKKVFSVPAPHSLNAPKNRRKCLFQLDECHLFATEASFIRTKLLPRSKQKRVSHYRAAVRKSADKNIPTTRQLENIPAVNASSERTQ